MTGGVRVPDERLDIIAKRLESHTYWPWPSAVADLAALVADLRALRADNQRLRECAANARRLLAPAHELDESHYANRALIYLDAIAAAEEPRA